MVCVHTPRGFSAIGQFYARFPQVSDEEVLACLERAAALQSPAHASTARAAGAADPSARSEEVEPEAGVARLVGYLTVPEGAPGIAVFVHGSGSSRHSPATGMSPMSPGLVPQPPPARPRRACYRVTGARSASRRTIWRSRVTVTMPMIRPSRRTMAARSSVSGGRLSSEAAGSSGAAR